ncbi:hypothetical protein D3C71_1624720 [compost metagenome]
MALELDADAFVRKHFGYRSAETTEDVVLLYGHHAFAASSSAQDGVTVDRLDRRHVDHPHGAPFGVHFASGGQGRMHGDAAGDDGQFFTLDMLMGLAEFEDHTVLVNDRVATATNAEIHWFVVGGGGLDGSDQLRAIRRRNHGQIGNRTHGGDVFGGMV